MSIQIFEQFSNGGLVLPGMRKDFGDLSWNKHPAFAGVELKHLLTAKETGGAYSFHLVRIAPDKSIGSHSHEKQLETHEVVEGAGVCINNGTEIEYKAGTISILPAGIAHEVHAGKDGLYLFAKFIPALC